MKKIAKGILTILLMAVVYMIVNGIAFSVMPFTEWFQENSAGQSTNLVLALLYMLWISGTMYCIVENAECKGGKLYLAVIGGVFFIQTFMTQIETIIFGSAFTGLGLRDVLLMVVGELISISVTGSLMILIVKGKYKEQEEGTVSIDWKQFFKYLLINGLIYMVIYFVFGYFVAWKSEELRIFYSGSSVDNGFLDRLYVNFRDSAAIYPIQYVRGMLFTVGVIPFMMMKWKHKYDFLIVVCAVFLCTAMGLMIPNFLFPDAVRLRHFVEMISSMTLFGVITATLMGRCRKQEQKELE